jgi:hypothetical protein
MNKEYKRLCTECGKERIYSSLESYCNSKKNIRCNSCAKSGNRNPQYKKPSYIRGKRMSDEFRQNASKRLKGLPSFFKGKKHSEETKLKMKISKLNHMLKNNGGISPRFNKKACEFIDDFGNKRGFNFRHALNKGEYYIITLNCFVDGYDEEKNIVFEYDEPHHYYATGQLKPKDIKRMNEIKHHLKCKFIRYNEKMNEIIEY